MNGWGKFWILLKGRNLSFTTNQACNAQADVIQTFSTIPYSKLNRLAAFFGLGFGEIEAGFEVQRKAFFALKFCFLVNHFSGGFQDKKRAQA
jgi:hypothetical protein